MLIAHVLPSMDPRGGGPLEGVLQLSTQLHAMGHKNEAITLDTPNEALAAPFPGQVHALGPSIGSYRYNAKLAPWLKLQAHRYDAISINGLWQYHSFGSWRGLSGINVPYFVFPHGMLDPWFKRKYPLKHLKKSLYWPLGDYRVLRDAYAVLFTSEEERRLAKSSFSMYRANERVLAFGIGTPPTKSVALQEAFLSICPDLRNKSALLFLGRLHEKKGCDLLIRAFAALARSQPQLRLIMAGPDQSGLADPLRNLAMSLGVADQISWPGMLLGDAKWGAFHHAEAFILPSHQENFGIAVVEALACGIPVLISDKVNIWREISAVGAGLVESDDVDGTQRLLTRWLATNGDDRHQMADAALRLFQQQFNARTMAVDFLNLIDQSTNCLSTESA